MKGGNQQPAIDGSEHLGPDSTGDNIEAKRVAGYVWNGTAWERQASTGVNPATTATVTSVGDTATSTQLIAANTSRKEVEFYNTSSGTLYLLKGAGTASATNFTVALGQNDYYRSTAQTAFQGVWSADAGGLCLITENT